MNGQHTIPIDYFNSPAQSLHFLQNNVKGQLLSRLSTGDPIYDTIISLVVLSCQATITGYLGRLSEILLSILSYIYWKMMWLIRYRKGAKNNIPVVLKEAKIEHITENREVNELYDPISWYINRLTDVKVQKNTTIEKTKNNPSVTQKIPKSRSSTFKFGEYEIAYKFTTELITIYADREYKRENKIITLTAELGEEVNIFEEFTKTAIKQYNKHIKTQEWEQCIYRNNDSGTWTQKSKTSSRRLDTVILKDRQMDDILDDVNDFVQKEEWYISRDIPYTRRFMFWGVPGTGKSSCIKALACYLKRHIHYLILSSVKSDSKLFSLLEKVNFEETILVIEDIDCASSVVNVRKECVDNAKDEDGEKKKDENDKKSTLTLSGLLNALDGGVIENYGQIMIVTTNHPEKLDPALVRPGRIDRRFEFSDCNEYQLERMFFNFFNEKPPYRVKFTNKISPADVSSIFLQYKNDSNQAWKAITQLLEETV